MPHQYVKKALEYSKNKLALELIRNENSSMLGLQRKVIIGRVTAKDKNGYYTVDANFKRWGEGDGEERHDSLWTVCRRPPLHTPFLGSFVLFPLTQKNLKRTVTPHTPPLPHLRSRGEKIAKRKEKHKRRGRRGVCRRDCRAAETPRRFLRSVLFSYSWHASRECVRLKIGPTRRMVKFHEKELKKGLGTRYLQEPLPSVGSEMRLLLRYIENPMGEMELSKADRVRLEREEGVWRELRRIHLERGIVKGRVLNSINGGYSVGIAGKALGHGFYPSTAVEKKRKKKKADGQLAT